MIRLQFDDALEASVLMDVLTDAVARCTFHINDGYGIHRDAMSITVAKRQLEVAERCRQELVRQIVEET